MNTPPARAGTGHRTPEIQLALSLDELNLVLEALGNLPFARVFALVGKVQSQAAEQLQASQAAAGSGSPPPAQG